MTLVLYFGTERRWPEERTLFERLKVSEALRPFLNDCRVNVLETGWLSKDAASVFTSDFRIVVDYFCQIRQTGKYVGTPQEVEHVDAVLKFLQAMTGNRSFETARTLVKKGERVTMVDVLARMQAQSREEGIVLGRREGRREGRMEGRMEGRAEVLFSLVNDGLLSAGVAAARANMSEDEFRARMERDRQDRQNGQ